MLVGLVATLIGRALQASATNMIAPRIIPSALFALCLRALTISALAFGSLSGAEKPIEAVSRATLENGLRVVVIHSSLAPVVTTIMNYLAGSNEVPQGFPGMAHALEHMMFRGSPGLSADQLANIAATMGGDFNADTQQVVTQFFFTVPKQDLDVALHIEAIRMRDVLATDALWDHERGAIERRTSVSRRSEPAPRA
jgi:zinc protease